MSDATISLACETRMCGNCYKGHDQEGGWCQCACHPLPLISGWAKLRQVYDHYRHGGMSSLCPICQRRSRRSDGYTTSNKSVQKSRSEYEKRRI